MKLSVDATKALVFIAVLAAVTVLIAMSKLDAEYLKFLLAWLIPGPLTFDQSTKDEGAK